MPCGCGASPQQSGTVQSLDLSLCADCGGSTGDYPLLFIIALLVVVLLRTFRRRTPILTLNLR